jgi:hypothetical protein
MTKEELLGHTRLGILILGILVLTIYGRACYNKKHGDQINIKGKVISVDNNSSLPNAGNSHPSISHNNDASRPRDNYIPPEGRTTIESKIPGKSVNDLIKISQKTFGFTFEPGISTAFIAEPNVGLDAKFAYFGRFGLVGGILAGRGLNLGVSPYMGISYRLDRIKYIHNTEVWLGFVPLATINYQLGLRINL